MKKVIAGGFLSLVGSIWAAVICLTASANLVNSWDSGLGRFWSTVSEFKLMVPFVIAAAFVVIGIVLAAVGLFSRD